MSNNQISPDKITKPIQLLAVWFVTLIAVNGSFLATASKIKLPEWLGIFLIIASVVNVFIFIFLVYNLLTKHRTKIQSDPYYAQYINRDDKLKTSKQSLDKKIKKNEDVVKQIVKGLESGKTDEKEIQKALLENEIIELADKHGYKRTISELFLRSSNWKSVISKWGHTHDFQKEISILSEDGLILTPKGNILDAQLTKLGKQVAEKAQEKGVLWFPDN